MSVRIEPAKVHETISKHMIMDVFDIVVDLERSHGSYLVDARTGREYLDFFTFLASFPIGFNHPKLTTEEFKERLLKAALNKPSNSDIWCTYLAEFVETFSKHMMPSYLPHLFLVEGGSVAIENGFKTAFDWKIQKNHAKGYKEERGTQIIHFQDAFHGRTGYSLSVTKTDPVKIMRFPKFKWPCIPNPKVKFPLTEENLAMVKNAEEEAIKAIKKAFDDNPDDIAAIVIEPVQGEGGDNHFRKEFFLALRRIADEYDAMLILDEIQTGMGLTGKRWAYEHFGIEPDIVAFGKKSQVCGIMVGKRVEENEKHVFNVSSRINSTWGGNLVDMVRAQRYIEIIVEEKLIENAALMGERLQAGLRALQEEFPKLVSNARGLGLMCAFDTTDSDKRREILAKARARGLIALPCGTRTIRLRPPLNVSRAEIDEGLEKLRKALAEVS